MLSSFFAVTLERGASIWRKHLEGGVISEAQNSVLTVEWQAVPGDIGFYPRMGGIQIEACRTQVEAAWNAESSDLALDTGAALSQQSLE